MLAARIALTRPGSYQKVCIPLGQLTQQFVPRENLKHYLVRVTAKQVTINNGPVVIMTIVGDLYFVHVYVLN